MESSTETPAPTNAAGAPPTQGSKPQSKDQPGVDEIGDSVNTYDQISNYNNYYEFTTNKERVARLAKDFKTSPWEVEVYGLVNKPQTFGIEDLLKKSFANYVIHQSRQNTGILPNLKYLWQDFIRHLNFLKDTGYVTTDNELTANGRWAAQLRVDQPLLIAEGFRRGVFPQKEPAILAGIIASFVNERETDDYIPPKLVPDSLLSAFSKVTRGLEPFAAKMTQHGFEVRSLQLRPATSLCAWASGT